MTTADHNHPEIERVLGRLVDFAEATTTTLHDLVLAQRDMAATLRDVGLALERIEARLGSIEDALRGPGRN
jgi:hypothetical protein